MKLAALEKQGPMDQPIVAPIKFTEMQKLSLHIRACRINRNMSQEDLAEAASIHRNSIGKIERFEMPVSMSMFFLLAKALRMTKMELMDF